MLDYLYDSAVNYQKRHVLKPNLVYLNNNHFQSLQKQLKTHHQLADLFYEFDFKIVLSPSLTHPSFACV